MLRVHLFGRPRLLLDEVALPTAARPKVVPLLGYVLLHRTAPLPRQAVANALWPDESEDEARANLRRHLNYVHRLLPEPALERPWILATPAHVQWNPAADAWLDVAEFEQTGFDPADLERAVALYAGELLEGVDDEWVAPDRERLRRRYLRALTALATTLGAARDYAPAIAAAERLLAEERWREDVLRLLVRLRYEFGDRAGALAAYERFAHALRAELGTEPMPETAAVAAAVARGEPVATPPGGGAARAQAAVAALPFAGREAEMDFLRERARAAAAGAGSLVIIGGEAGVGKTRLMREFGAACEASGAHVYSAAVPPSEATPHQPFVALLRGAEPLAETLQLDPVWLAALARLSPGIPMTAAPLPALPRVDPARERVRLFEAYAQFWHAAGARRPVVLVIEDVHWAGGATLALLEHMARSLVRSRVLLVATYREEETCAAPELRGWRRRLERDAVAAHVALPRLAPSAVEDIVRRVGDSDDSARLARFLYEHSEGSPFFLEAIVHELAQTGRLRMTDRRWHVVDASAFDVPALLREALAARLRRLGVRAATLAGVAAVVGRAFDVELLRETTGWAEATVLDALGELLDRRIINEEGGGFDFAFGHHLMQAVTYDGLSDEVRTRRHRRVAQVLARLHAAQPEAVAGELARHWELGGKPETAAVQYVVAARAALAVFGHEEAAAQAARALALGTSERVRFQALLVRERVASLAGDRAAQLRDLCELRALARRLGGGRALAVVERRLDLANVTGDRRRERTLIAVLERRAASTGDDALRARALQAAARYHRSVSDFAAARRVVGELQALSERRGDRATSVDARIALADTYVYEGRLADAAPVLSELRSMVDAGGNPAALVRTLMAFSRAALTQQDYAAMSDYAQEAYDISRRIGDREGEALALHMMANGLVYTFRIAEAEDEFRRALALYERIGYRVGIASICVDFGLLHTELGLLDEALLLYGRANEVAGEIGHAFVLTVAAVNESYTYRLKGDAQRAKAEAEKALGRACAIGSQHLESAALGVLGAAECALGDAAAAVAHLTRGVELRRPTGPTPRLGDNLCALARATLRSGDVAAATAAVDELLRMYEANPNLAPQPAEWLSTAADVLRAAGQPARAAALLRQADSVVRARAAAIPAAAARAAFFALPFHRAVTEAPVLT